MGAPARQPPPGRRQVGAGDVGRRVVVRYRLPDGRATDVLGELVRADAEGLAVSPDVGAHPPGALVTVAAGDVVASRVVPLRRPPPSPRDHGIPPPRP